MLQSRNGQICWYYSLWHKIRRRSPTCYEYMHNIAQSAEHFQKIFVGLSFLFKYIKATINPDWHLEKNLPMQMELRNCSVVVIVGVIIIL